MVMIAACSGNVDQPTIGTYRAVLELPGGEAPFRLEVANQADKIVLYLVNDTQRTLVADVRTQDGELQAEFPGKGNSLRAKLRKRTIDGHITLVADGEPQVIAFHARLGETHRFFTEVLTDNADVSGRWDVQLQDSAGKTTPGVALLHQQHDRVTGTIMTADADHRFLEGQVRGDEAQLSLFAGGIACLYRFEVNAQGDLEGEYWQGLKAHGKFVARRNADAELPRQ